MSNPASTALMEEICRQVAEVAGLPAAVVSQIVRHQWRSVLAATKTGWTVELSGLGYLVCSRRKMQRNLSRAYQVMDHYRRQLDIGTTSVRMAGLTTRIKSCEQLIEKYQKRLEP